MADDQVPRRTATVNVIGKDKRGVIAKVCTFMFEQGGNIEELDQHVTHGLFSMVMEISWPADSLHEDDVRRGLDGLARELDMTILFRPHGEGERLPRVAAMVTTEPQCLERIAADVARGTIRAEIAVVASNKPDLGPLAKRLGLPFIHVDDRDKPAHEAALLAEFDKREVDYVVLARYMRILSPNFVWRYPNRILNVHPSLLPSFPGAYAYRQAVAKGVRVAGVTSHIVTMNLDEGPIVCQEAFRIEPGESVDSVRAKGQALEAKVLSDGLKLLLDGRLDIHWGKAEILQDDAAGPGPV